MLNRPFKSVIARTAIFALALSLAISFISVGMTPAVLAQEVECTSSAVDSVTCTYEENGTDTVTTFSASDPEGNEIEFDLTGADATDFDITDGVLTFLSSPNFEAPADADTDNVYNIMVRATEVRADDDAGAADSSTIDVTITVTDVDEPGTVTIDLRQPEVGVALTAELADPDSGAEGTINTSSVTWLWSIPKTSRPEIDNEQHWQSAATTGFTAAAFTPVATNEGKYLRVRVKYTDAAGAGKTAYAKSEFTARASVTGNNAPPSLPSPTTSRDVAEDAAVGAAVGDSVTATDSNGDILTYSIDETSPDEASFSIDKATGQITVKTSLDHEAGSVAGADPVAIPAGDGKYVITVVVTDPHGDTDTTDVEITATDVNEAPTVAGAVAADIDFAENGAIATALDTYTGTDVDDGDTVTLSLSGDDADVFDLSATGVLTFKASPDFEAPTDANGDRVYKVTVVASDTNLTGELAVSVSVTNVNEAGTLTLSSIQPATGAAFTVMLSDDDGGVTNEGYQWASSGTSGGTFTDIDDATSASYTPTAGDPDDDSDDGDIGNYLQVKVTYRDDQSVDGVAGDRALTIVSTNAVRKQPDTNATPVFAGESISLEVDENTAADGNVGEPVKATDADEDALSYSRSGGADKDAFEINQASGQITVGAGTDLDYETKTTYMVEVTAMDPFGASGTVMVTIAVANVNEEPTLTGTDAVSYEENGTDSVAAYTATDPEEATIDWDLTGADATVFDITGGVLTFLSSPNFEDPADADTDNVYNIRVRATEVRAADAEGAAQSTTIAVTVTVTDVEEPGTATIDLRQPEVGVALTAKLADPDSGADGTINTSSVTWLWSIPKTSRPEIDNEQHWQSAATTGFTAAAFTPVATNEGKYLRVRVEYTDAAGAGKTAYAKSEFTARAAVLDADNAAPSLPALTATRDVAEDAAVGAAVGDSVTATDSNGDILTYSIDETSADEASFSIDKATGQITVAGSLDHEAGSVVGTTPTATAGDGIYVITVVVTDPHGDTDTTDVEITATDVNEAPTVAGAVAADIDFAENGAIATALDTYTGTDVDDGDTVTLSLSGDDADVFDLSATGVLTFKASPDFEAPTDANGDRVYKVTVVASDTNLTGELAVSVSVTNVNEAGTLTLSSIQPATGAAFTVMLSDDDGGVTNEGYQWASSGTSGGTFTDIDDATSASYTPTAGDPDDDSDDGDIGNYLQVKVTYRDDQSVDGVAGDRALTIVSTNAVRKQPDTNADPVFAGESISLEVDENTAADGNVGEPVKATDADEDALSYSLSGGADKDAFEINQTSAQITVGAGTDLDYETKTTYAVQVKAEDPFGASGTVMVTITVINVDEPPTITFGDPTLAITGSTSASYTENDTAAVAPYTATGPGASSATWSLSGDDSGEFAISGGELRFATSPDFEAPTDADTDNVYNVTVNVSDGTNDASLNVDVTVTNADEDGTLTLSSDQPEVGAELTATLDDPDGGVTGETWQWAREADDASYADIDGATSAAYTPVDDDDGKHLRVTVNYDDAAGDGQTEMQTSANPVSATPAAGDYDANNNGTIERDEVIQAIRDYFADVIDRDEVIAVIRLYFSS